ncbi:MAG: UDP-N-acetylglucosamine--N-acetylmuramyl-(pentapeptide) pyrophosphoryl-undecaprenol N-acetylglucosamine transferase [Leptospiraceae bacterium]|nr:UDP-N-acetylglucosamine--N-acetylmuramyl-(pentapeptide) pyrophosphoryl-undecaprenol N-acetylglucosamine transferase [Leptospiraceae bacterium]MDW7976580.1 UDP-N-acetylglucosamine--N-acetylmuramyl-(pentapeptide) pyrophosphoryl-undecaprenol N-acetylglucosamine transferase [Leptospiraceae bacterium]
MELRVLIVAGGTGGHISPGIALYEAFQKDYHAEILSLERNRNYPDFQKNSFYLNFYDVPQFSWNLFSIFWFFYKIIRATIYSIKLIKKHQFNFIVGMGGYPTIPAIIAGILLRKKIYLCEPNAYPGLTTRVFYRFAKRVFLNFTLTKEFSHIQKKSILTGNPIRERVFNKAKKRKRHSKIKTIFLVGGSQGAKQLNEMILNLWKSYPDFSQQFDWIIQTGIPHFERFSQEVEAIPFRKKIEFFGFSTEIEKYFQRADLLISRAGAGIITEGLLYEIPMILIPYPYAKDNHQYYNAKALEEQHLAITIPTKTTEPYELYETIKQIKNNFDKYKLAFSQKRITKNPSEIIKEIIASDGS